MHIHRKLLQSAVKFVALFAISVFCTVSVVAAADNVDDILADIDKKLDENDYPAVIAGYNILADIYKENPEEHGKFANIFFDGGDICYDACRYIEALEFYTLAMRVAEKAGDRVLYNRSLMLIGNVYGLFEDYDRAIFYFRRCLDTAREERDYDMISKSLVSLVMASAMNGDTSAASKYFVQQTQFPMKDSEWSNFYNMFNQGLIAASSGNNSAARFYYDKALGYVEQYEMGTDAEYAVKSAMGESYISSGDLDKALDIFTRFLDEVDGLERHDLMIDAYLQLYIIYKKTGDTEKEKEYFNKYHMSLDSMYNADKFSKAKNKLLQYEDQAKREKINELSRKVTIQFVVIVVILLVVGTLITMLVIIFRQKKNLDASYRLLIEKEKALDKSAQESRMLRDQYVKMIDVEELPSLDEAEDEDGDSGVLRREQKEVLISKIAAVMENTDMVFSPDFNLALLAREVGSNVKYVSYVINDTYNLNFKAFVNSYRLREACRLLKDTDEQIQDISMKVGYNSPNSFIKVFKKAMGMTPTVYKKLVIENSRD